MESNCFGAKNLRAAINQAFQALHTSALLSCPQLLPKLPFYFHDLRAFVFFR
jgi:hypothetical protein